VPLPRARRSLGQHFLTDPRILERIAAALDPEPDDVVVEIGAGTGSLTRIIAARVGTVVAIETDARLAEACRTGNAAAGVTNVAIVMGDALALDWPKVLANAAPGARSWKLAGNIPYNITTPLLELAVAQAPERIVFLVQSEVADRIGSAPGSKVYGGLSVGIQAVSRVERLFTVRAGSFTPPPRVDSAVIRLRPRPEPLVRRDETAAFRTFVAACFSRRRKQLGTIVRALRGGSAAEVGEALARLGIDPEARPETLAPEEFVRLWRWVLASGGLIVK
jgi:16S rRNA (adenine1518-N6/adenine1519-N6)-dimethyltransferase